MIQAAMKIAMQKAKEKAMEKAKGMAVDKVKEKAMSKLSEAGQNIMSAPERMFDGQVSATPAMSGMGGMDAPHAPLAQSQAQYMPIQQMQGMQQGMQQGMPQGMQQGMPMQQANPYGSAAQNMGLMELLEQAARMR